MRQRIWLSRIFAETNSGHGWTRIRKKAFSNSIRVNPRPSVAQFAFFKVLMESRESKSRLRQLTAQHFQIAFHRRENLTLKHGDISLAIVGAAQRVLEMLLQRSAESRGLHQLQELGH